MRKLLYDRYFTRFCNFIILTKTSSWLSQNHNWVKIRGNTQIDEYDHRLILKYK